MIPASVGDSEHERMLEHDGDPSSGMDPFRSLMIRKPFGLVMIGGEETMSRDSELLKGQHHKWVPEAKVEA